MSKKTKRPRQSQRTSQHTGKRNSNRKPNRNRSSNRQSKRKVNQPKRHYLRWLMLAVVLTAMVFFLPAYWFGFQYKQQLISHDYSADIDAKIQVFMQREHASRNAKHDQLIKSWEGAGKQFLANNLANTKYHPNLYFESKHWRMRWVGINTFALDADLKLQRLRVQLKRTNLIQWQLDSICLLDVDRVYTAC